MAEYVVYEGRKPRDPANILRAVAPDGRAFHVIRSDAMRDEQRASAMPLDEAIREALSRAGLRQADGA